jgi:DNA-binding beta-propeller fold protein YncE
MRPWREIYPCVVGHGAIKRSCRLALLSVVGSVAGSGACTVPYTVTLHDAGPPLTLRYPALYPETVAYDERNQTLLVSSLRDGAIYAVDARGGVTKKLQDPRLCSVLGFAVDGARGRLWAVNDDLGLSVRPSAPGPKQLAHVAVFDLASGTLLRDIDLGPLLAGPHLLNGIAVNPATGRAFVTDSFSPAIYEIDADGAPSLFLRDAAFAGDGINLNGVVVHPDGYLLVVKKSDGTLFKVPLAEPARFTRVSGAGSFVGGDGLMLVGKEQLVIVANRTPQFASNAAFAVTSDDGWSTARVREVRPLGDVYPTTSVIRDHQIFVLASSLNELMQAPAAEKGRLAREGALIPIGRVTP